MCVAPPNDVGAWSMAVLLGQPFQYYYHYLKAASIFNHKTWPEDLQELATFGESALHTMLEHFQSLLERNDCDLASAEREWATMKVYIFRHLKMLQYESLWQRMLSEHAAEYKNVLMQLFYSYQCPLLAANGGIVP